MQSNDQVGKIIIQFLELISKILIAILKELESRK